MLCYLDRTFCDYYVICKKGKDCPRALTRDVSIHAESCGLRICKFVDKPDCFDLIDEYYQTREDKADD